MKNRYGFGENAPGNNSVSNIISAPLKGIVKTLPLRVLSLRTSSSGSVMVLLLSGMP